MIAILTSFSRHDLGANCIVLNNDEKFSTRLSSSDDVTSKESKLVGNSSQHFHHNFAYFDHSNSIVN